MSWSIGEFDFDEKTSRNEMELDIYDSLYQNRGAMDLISQELKLDYRTPFKNRDDAKRWVSSNADNRDVDYGVRYLDYPELSPSKRMRDLQRRISETESKRRKYEDDHSVVKRQSAYIGCPKCGSKLARQYLLNIYDSNRCPLCSADLRPQSTLDTIDGYWKKIRELEKELQKETRKQEEKQRKKAKVMWYVSAAMYIG